MKKIYIIAGEESGDIIGAEILQFLNKDAQVFGVGGIAMQEQGLKSLFDFSELSIMGITGVLKSYKRLKYLLNKTVEDIKEINPDIIITIDAQGFSKRVAAAVQDMPARKIHIVAPTVWAWRKGRTKKYSKLFDDILCLFPFEPEYFDNHDVNAVFIGHPASQNIERIDSKKLKKRHNIAQNATVIGLCAGSRKSEISTLLPIYLQAIKKLQNHQENIHIVIPTLERYKEDVISTLNAQNIAVPYTLTLSNEKKEAFSSMDYALCTSGTVTLEVALLNIPMIVAYKVSGMTYGIVSRLYYLKTVSLPNILLGDIAIIPEYLQKECNAESIGKGLSMLMADKGTQQKEQFEKLPCILKAPEKSFGKNAAHYILNCIEK